MSDSAVIVQDLTKAYNSKTVVDSLSFHAELGTVTALLGPNGAGKTTTIECCEGLRAPDSGQVRILGHDPLTATPDQRARVGAMLQDGGLPTGVRAAELLHHMARLYRDPLDVSDLITRLGIDAFATTTVRRLSGGQRQRVALGAAVIGRPQVVFLDEPSAGLDPQSRHAVWDLVKELKADGVGIVLTTHLMDEAEHLADQVIIMDHGSIIAEGSTRDLLSSDLSTVVLNFSNTQDAGQAARILGSTAHIQENFTLTSLPLEVTLTGAATAYSIADIATILAANSILATSINTGPQSLEDLFLDLTGRHLR